MTEPPDDDPIGRMQERLNELARVAKDITEAFPAFVQHVYGEGHKAGREGRRSRHKRKDRPNYLQAVKGLVIGVPASFAAGRWLRSHAAMASMTSVACVATGAAVYMAVPAPGGLTPEQGLPGNTTTTRRATPTATETRTVTTEPTMTPIAEQSPNRSPSVTPTGSAVPPASVTPTVTPTGTPLPDSSAPPETDVSRDDGVDQPPPGGDDPPGGTRPEPEPTVTAPAEDPSVPGRSGGAEHKCAVQLPVKHPKLAVDDLLCAGG